jgi:hypothetical protein
MRAAIVLDAIATSVQTESPARQTLAMEPIATATSAEDIAYISTHYITFSELSRGLPGEADWPGTHLPRATYRTPDGALWFPRDWWRLHDDAGSVAALRELFDRRLAAAAARLGHRCDLAGEWQDYLAGLYGACLRDVTPESIAHKAHLIARLDCTLAEPLPGDPRWQDLLRGVVESLDQLSRPFAACDRIRFGRPTSRDRLITDVRARYPQAFAA